MKRKNIYNLLSGLFALSLLMFASCEDYAYDTDSSYSRLFRVTDLKATAGATDVELSWSATPNTSYYILELSKDSFNVDIVRFGEDKSITRSPFAITELDNTTQYYVRIKSCSDGEIPDSEWATTEKGSFTTSSEQIMESVSSGDRTATTVTLRWTPGAAVTHIYIAIPEEEENIIKRVDLDAEAIAEGTITIDGLTQLTTYMALLYNNDVRRGFVTFQTAADIPVGDGHVEYLNAGDSLNQDLFDKLAIEHDNVTLVLEAGALFAYNSTLQIPDGMSVHFFGNAGDSKPIMAISMLDISGTHSFINFTNLEITGEKYEEGVKTNTKNGYLINQEFAAGVDEINFEDCVIHTFGNTPFRFKEEAETKVVNTLKINNCIAYGSDSYAFIHINKCGSGSKIDAIILSNSTFYNIPRFILHDNGNNSKLIITDCTMNNMIQSSRYFIDYSANFGPTEEFRIENTILGKSQGGRGIRCSNSGTSENFWSTSDWVTESNAITLFTNSYAGTSEDLFEDPNNGNFTIKDTSFNGRSTAGDPRWR